MKGNSLSDVCKFIFIFRHSLLIWMKILTFLSKEILHGFSQCRLLTIFLTVTNVQTNTGFLDEEVNN